MVLYLCILMCVFVYGGQGLAMHADEKNPDGVAWYITEGVGLFF